MDLEEIFSLLPHLNKLATLELRKTKELTEKVNSVRLTVKWLHRNDFHRNDFHRNPSSKMRDRSDFRATVPGQDCLASLVWRPRTCGLHSNSNKFSCVRTNSRRVLEAAALQPIENTVDYHFVAIWNANVDFGGSCLIKQTDYLENSIDGEHTLGHTAQSLSSLQDSKWVHKSGGARNRSPR